MAASRGFLDSHDHNTCPAKLALEVMQGRWKIPVLRELAEGTQRFSELSRSLRGVSPKVLSSTLRELEANGVDPHCGAEHALEGGLSAQHARAGPDSPA